ncbi:MAG: aldehyde dehydrogenase, partial [Pseudomonadota bacterium]|nr:aldehyde dehydrogenase [Pseudomonadota bacterium]
MQQVLKNLGLAAVNPGTWSSRGGWLTDPAARPIDSTNPATGEIIASVLATTPAQYEQVMAAAHEVALAWRAVP